MTENPAMEGDCTEKEIYYELLDQRIIKIENDELIIYNSLYYEERPQ